MTQEEKELLIKDLCARQPYKVKISVDDDNLFIPTLKYIDRIICHFYECAWTKYIDNIKPYLRPMSSMTEEEKEELENIEEKYFGQALDKQIKECLSSSPKDESRKLEYFASSKIVDYLNKHHFDYHNLIEKGLAIEAPKGMYKN